MKAWTQLLKADRIYTAGLVILILNTLFFIVPMDKSDEAVSLKFFEAYLTFIGYFITVLVDNKRETGRLFKFYSLPHNLILLLLGNLSAYSLNLLIPVFEVSVTWLSVFLVLQNGVLALVGLRRKFGPDAFNHVAVAVICSGLLFHVYQLIYIIPLMGYGLLFGWFFGIPLHSFVPLWWTIVLARLLARFVKTSNVYWKSAAIGWALPMTFLIGFIARWSSVNDSVTQAHHELLAPIESEGLPEWAMVGQHISEDWMTEKILNSRKRGSFDGITPRTLLHTEEGWRHDPLITLAALFSWGNDLPPQEMDQVQDALFNSRHKTEPRLWSGTDLQTTDIVTNVQLFPNHRLAYTEKTLLIENTQAWEGNQQEAIYSFYLPEGSVVTSASLWLGELEEKAYLTTRQKADTAYQTIVGRERRDPMLVRWQEGNRVSVRVFPCTPSEKRKFKIGITSPLRFEGNELIYKNIDFDGPDEAGAKETVSIISEGGMEGFSSSISLKQKGNLRQYAGSYKADWSLEMTAPPLSQEPFSFNGRSFRLLPFSEKLVAFSPKEIYLDLNDGWSKRQFNAVWEQVKNKEVYAWSGGLVRLTEDNRGAIFDELKQLNYSLFPFHKIQHPSEALVITAPCGFSPVTGDLDNAAFAKQLLAFFSDNKNPVRVVNLGEEVSPYMKGLAETRALQVYSEEWKTALQLIENQQFPMFQEDAQTIALPRAGMKIQSAADLGSSSKAPDHLLRLFAYNDLMKQLGSQFSDDKNIQESHLAQAQEAYIVTPVSTLVSLESEKDYERFDIKPAGENSLKNASLQSSGAVPEPHEWLLLVLLLSAAGVLRWKLGN